jgi:hypothetical protein
VRNHREKVKDMSRSVLPSTGRKAARDRRRVIHKRQRSLERAGLTEYRRIAEREDVTPDFRGRAGPQTRQMVLHRRARDKTGPLVRWAQATIAADPVLRSAPRAEQARHFARLMPDTLIGEHAVRHIEWALEWRDLRAGYSRRARPASGRSPRIVETERQVREILASGLHGTLNRELRKVAERQAGWPASARPVPRRPLLGAHDAAAFADEMAGYRDAVAVITAVAAGAGHAAT